MRLLRLTTPIMRGEDVRQWQAFLLGRGYTSLGRADGAFGSRTDTATKNYQRQNRLKVDGVVGSNTIRAAQAQGFRPSAVPTVPAAPGQPTTPTAPSTPSTVPAGSRDFPPRPTDLPLPTLANAQQLFGTFAYTPNPSAFNGRGITITDNWERSNITIINIPQLRGVPVYGTPSSGNMRVHRNAADQIRRLFQAWEDAGLTNLILSFSGAFTPRFIGRTQTLSNHAFGAAFDINEQWNGQPATPAATGATGSVRELVPIANELGFYWGGHYSRSPDGMHFELVAIR